MRASLIQIGVDQDEPVESRRKRASTLVRDTHHQTGADLIVLPELWNVGAFAFQAFAASAEPVDGPTAEVMSAAARDAGVWLHAGSIVERAPAAGGEEAAGEEAAGEGPAGGGSAARDDGAAGGDGTTLYNTSLLFDPSGTLVRTYRKIHRFGFDKGEAVLMGAGTEVVTASLPDTTIGLATCYDLRFPELFRLLIDAGAQLLVIPAGWPERRREHWTLLARARAVENQAYVLACGTAGTHAGVEQAGHSIVVDPWGEVLAEAGAGESVLTVDLDLNQVTTTRAQFPVLRDRVLDVR
ncbi:carbon-nitrogen family hydrolase [Streptomyces zagrosensis]|uniref:Putative amidohydrolase n=1 Tax=Streptomyces zagrosensis TaxID=1042984 RepID=A0A7W9Q7K9_9ACTN|nr:carbon-nitrogen family hydrolase [Streptomyces zagrosensis]MBB5934012.1 putative amidohydrolase [Streptomyces zagrosensis]